ncbi:PEP-CTERM sorting domain-containing protein [Rubritalea tangerina]
MLCIGACTSLQAATISINMTDGGPGGGVAVAGNTAGAELAGYWNTLGRDGTGKSGTDIANLLDDTGASSGVGITQSAAQGGWYSSASGFSGTIGNNFMTNFADASGAYNYTFTGLNAGVGAVYDVIIYSARGFSNTGVTKFDVNGETLYLTNESMVGDYTESGWATQGEAENNLSSGNYVRFRNVSLDTLVVGIEGLDDATNGGTLAAVNGIQIVAVPEPSSVALLGLGGIALVLRRRR